MLLLVRLLLLLQLLLEVLQQVLVGQEGVLAPQVQLGEVLLLVLSEQLLVWMRGAWKGRMGQGSDQLSMVLGAPSAHVRWTL
jgi:hypothetical protein